MPDDVSRYAPATHWPGPTVKPFGDLRVPVNGWLISQSPPGPIAAGVTPFWKFSVQ